MSRTTKNEHRTDGWNTCRMLERTARPAGRILNIVEAELAADADEGWDMVFIPAEPDMPEFDLPLHNTPCGGYCRRCLLHDDPGGCLG